MTTKVLTAAQIWDECQKEEGIRLDMRHRFATVSEEIASPEYKASIARTEALRQMWATAS
jgi:hypothetical protein